MSNQPHAEILRSRSKKNPFKVRYIGANGEIISTSELLSTKWNCQKNIRAMVDMVFGNCNAMYMVAIDKTGKTPKEIKVFS